MQLVMDGAAKQAKTMETMGQNKLDLIKASHTQYAGRQGIIP